MLHESSAHCLIAGRPVFLRSSNIASGWRRLLVSFRSLGLEVDAMTVKIHHIEGVESTISFDVTGSYQIGLVDVVKAQSLSEIGILDAFRRIRGFF